ncbi:hypothetical protein SAMN04487996_101279 [Dyadobacter soli]|uniref:Uncharacterized protein n=1 Tax=Dyadobacter soli TaxID=659014 RepID=A0A1G6VN15_9BACT|nr:hypothetical protein SAMN04487996_101279 [Dyadobacter soli]
MMVKIGLLEALPTCFRYYIAMHVPIPQSTYYQPFNQYHVIENSPIFSQMTCRITEYRVCFAPNTLSFFNKIAIRNQTVGGEMDDYIGVRLIGLQLVSHDFAYVAFMPLNAAA